MKTTLILAGIGIAAMGIIKALIWRINSLKKQRDEAVQKGSVANVVIQNVKEAQTIKKSNAQRTSHDRTQRMCSKGYLRD